MGRKISFCDLAQCDENLISLTVFGSYNEKVWISGKSDIDILALVKHSDFHLEYSNEVIKLNYRIDKNK